MRPMPSQNATPALPPISAFVCRARHLEQKYSWCHVPEIISVGFFLGEKACRAECFALPYLYFCSKGLAGDPGREFRPPWRSEHRGRLPAWAFVERPGGPSCRLIFFRPALGEW